MLDPSLQAFWLASVLLLLLIVIFSIFQPNLRRHHLLQQLFLRVFWNLLAVVRFSSFLFSPLTSVEYLQFSSFPWYFLKFNGELLKKCQSWMRRYLRKKNYKPAGTWTSFFSVTLASLLSDPNSRGFKPNSALILLVSSIEIEASLVEEAVGGGGLLPLPKN